MARTNDEAFAPIGVQWIAVSPALTKARWTSWSLLFAVLIVAALALLAFPAIARPVCIAAILVVLIAYLWGMWYFARRTKSWGYCEREDDLIVTRGFMFRRLVIVPYGRMQLVDVSAGPIERKCGIARLQLHTAAATTDAAIPGLTPAVASVLRDKLAHLAEERAAGL